jgi:hypothetical protein
MKVVRWLATVIAIASVLGTFGCVSFVNGSGKPETRTFELTGFTSVVAGNTFKIDIAQGPVFSVNVTADDNLWDDLDISVSGKTLRLAGKPGLLIRSVHLRAKIVMPVLATADINGASSATIHGFDSDDTLRCIISGASGIELADISCNAADIDISGASHMTGGIKTGDCDFDISGASRATLTGTGRVIKLNVSGASNADFDEFAVQSAAVTLSGASNARIDAGTITKANLSGASHLVYNGLPSITGIQTSGASTIGQEP